MEKKVVIIGAGIAGLSAGCYARMNGYNVEIHETHNLPGGFCTSWKRGNYVVDGCIHWLTDSRPGTGFYRIWEELGAVQGRQMFDHDVFSSVVGLDGRTLHFYTDVDRLEEHLKELSPRDAGAIKELCGLIRRLASFSYTASCAIFFGPGDGQADQVTAVSRRNASPSFLAHHIIHNDRVITMELSRPAPARSAAATYYTGSVHSLNLWLMIIYFNQRKK